MTPAQIEDLRRKAKAATPGPWTTERPKSDGDGFAHGVAVAATYGRQMIYADPPGGSFPAADRAFIAAANPAVVLELLEALGEARFQRDRALRFAVQVWEADDPSEPIADNGATVWHGLQQAAKPLVDIAVDLGLAETP